VKDADQELARKRTNQVRAAITDAMNQKKTDLLSETIVISEQHSTSAGLRAWNYDKDYLTRLRWSVIVGIALSTIGLLFVSIPRTAQSPPASKTPGRVSLAFLVLGLWGAFVLEKYFGFYGGMPALGLAILTGIQAMIFGLSGRANRLGKYTAAISWCGMLGLFTAFFLRDYSSYRNSGWAVIAIPPSDGATAPHIQEKPENMDREEKIGAVKTWLESIDAGNYDEAWKWTSSLTRTLETESGWIDKLKLVRNPLGKVINRKNPGTKWTRELQGAPKGSYYIFTFNTDFATKSDALETVTLIYQEDGKWRILGYSIQ
jgi:hypothetical protein